MPIKLLGRNYNLSGRKNKRCSELPSYCSRKSILKLKFKIPRKATALKTEVHNPEFQRSSKIQLFKRNKMQFYRILSVISSTLGEKKGIRRQSYFYF